MSSTKGITVGNEIVRAVIYADDITLINNDAVMTNRGLRALSEAGTYIA